MVHILSTEEVERTYAALERHRRHDGTYNLSKSSRELGIQRSTLQARIAGAMTGRYGAPPPSDVRPTLVKSHAPDDLRASVRTLLRNTPRHLDELVAQLGEPAGAILEAIEALEKEGTKIGRVAAATFVVHTAAPAPAYLSGPVTEIVSRPDNTFVIGAIGDLHAGSKYTRWDAREDLIRRAEKRGAQAIFDTGNWIDGEASFNRYDLEAVGLDAQCQMLARRHPKTKLPIYAVTGDDHEGWYEGREGVNIGWYCEKTMREAGHDWTNLGYMEAHVRLVNANTGKSAIAAVVHPGGGSAYALSYRPQKIIESYEGGEKPAVVFFGHYHKMDAGNVRNVWYAQTGCCFTAATRIETKDGRKRISDIRVGDEVLTHKGRYRPVVRLFKRKYSREFVSINYGRKGRFDQTVTATAEHPILVGRDGAREWLKFEDVRPDDVIFVTGKDCPVAGERIPYYMTLSKHANPMDRAEARAASSAAARLRSDYAGGRLKRSNAKDVHFARDILPFCEIMREQGWSIVPVGNSITPDAVGFKDGKVVAFELESAGGALLQFKRKKYDDAPINKFVDEVRWVDLTPRVEQPRSWYEADQETGFVGVKVLEVTRGPVKGAHNRKSVTVYNFEVAEDNSYVAGHCVVHNCQDQTPFMRKKSLEAHVGGLIVSMEQDPNTGAIIGFEPAMIRYFHRGYYDVGQRWSRHGEVGQAPRER